MYVPIHSRVLRSNQPQTLWGSSRCGCNSIEPSNSTGFFWYVQYSLILLIHVRLASNHHNSQPSILEFWTGDDVDWDPYRTTIWRFPPNGGTPEWWVHFMENPIYGWWLGYPYFRKASPITYPHYMSPLSQSHTPLNHIKSPFFTAQFSGSSPY